MVSVRVISTSTVQAPPSHNYENGESTRRIDLTPWDLQFLPIETIQKGLLFHHTTPNQTIHTLKHSLSSTLSFFPPFAGRFIITEHHEDDNNNNNNNNASCFITCNNAGALFVHAAAENTTVADILKPNYVPPIVRSFFPLNGVRSCEGTTQPLLAVQVTELLDGVFIGCTVNHAVADGKSFWHFINSWAEISRGSGTTTTCLKISKLPSLVRWFPNDIDPPIRFPFTMEEATAQKQRSELNPIFIPPERIFHFTKEKIAQLKSKANAEANTEKIIISSLQAVLTHVWRSVIRCKRVDPKEEIRYVLLVGVRPRLVPPLPEDYFGNAALDGAVTMKAGELLEQGGLGKGASELNKVISLHCDEKIKSHYECWCRAPRLITIGNMASSNSLATSSSPRFDVYGNDFGWGKPVAVRSGGANKRNGKITVFAGSEEGSFDIEVCLPYEILEAMGNDPEFMDIATSN